MSTVWVTIVGLCLATLGMKAAGPLALRGRRPPRRVMSVIALVAPSVLTSLVLYQTFTAGQAGITVDARAAGLGVAALAVAARAPMLVVVVLAALATGLARLLLA